MRSDSFGEPGRDEPAELAEEPESKAVAAQLRQIASNLRAALEALSARSDRPPVRSIDEAVDAALLACGSAVGASTKAATVDRLAELSTALGTAAGDAAAAILAEIMECRRLPGRSQHRNRALSVDGVGRSLDESIADAPAPGEPPHDRERILHAALSPKMLGDLGRGVLAGAFPDAVSPRRIARRAAAAPTPERLATVAGAIRHLHGARDAVVDELEMDPAGARRISSFAASLGTPVPVELSSVLSEILPREDPAVDDLAAAISSVTLDASEISPSKKNRASPPSVRRSLGAALDATARALWLRK